MLKGLFKKKNLVIKEDIIAPISGEYVDLAEVPDPIFFNKMVGDGAAIQPKLGRVTVLSPVNGKIVMLAETNHAIGISSDNGLEILIHIGLDTVELKGLGFKPLVKLNEKVKLRQPVMEVDMNIIKSKGKETITPIIITNSDNNLYNFRWNKEKKVEAGKTVLFSVELQR
jgi:PTS system glucose-specific IIA component